MTQRAILYCRQSRTEIVDDSLSLDAQERILRDHAARLGWSVVAAIRDADLQGWRDRDERPGLAEVLDRCARGEADTVLVYDLSRLARSVRLQENILHDLARHGVDVVSHREPEASNAMFRQILAAIAEQQTRTQSAYTRAALKGRALRGLHHGGPTPYGYRREDAGTPMAPDPDEASIVAGIFGDYAAGAGPSAIAEGLTDRGVSTRYGLTFWRPSRITKMLDSRIYIGDVRLNGTWYPGAHPPLIDPTTWGEVSDRRGRLVRSQRRKTRDSWLEGMIRHECGRRMYLMPASRRHFTRAYFRCASSVSEGNGVCSIRPRSIIAETAEAAARAALVTDLAAMVSVREAIATTRASHRRESAGTDAIRAGIVARAGRIQARRARTEELYLAGARDRAWFDRHEAEAVADLAAAQAERDSLPTPVDPAGLAALRETISSFRDILARGTDDQMRQLLALVGEATIGPGGLRITYRGQVALLVRPVPCP